MKNAFAVCLIFLAACAAGLTSSERTELDGLRQQQAERAAADRDARLKRAEKDGWKPSPAQPAAAPPASAAPAGRIAPVGSNYAVAAMRVQGQKPAYLGDVNTVSRQLGSEPYISLVNHVCDYEMRRRATGACNRDKDGRSSFKSYLAFKIEGRPVQCTFGADSPGYIHPQTGESLLGPEDTCHIGIIGLRKQITVTVIRYEDVRMSERRVVITLGDHRTESVFTEDEIPLDD